MDIEVHHGHPFKLDLFVVGHVNNECILILGVIGDSVLVSHFSIAEDVGDSLWVEPDLTPVWKISFQICLKGPSIGEQLHDFRSFSDVGHHAWVAKDSHRRLVVKQDPLPHVQILEALNVGSNPSH